jgi:serine/threonine protein kinase HipA of HipAB toxin-antitoxin module
VLLNLLKGSDAPDEDQEMLIKALAMFWLLGATDGHAKNFSTHLSPGGRFRMTPLYDIVSAQPSVDAGHLPWLLAPAVIMSSKGWQCATSLKRRRKQVLALRL